LVKEIENNWKKPDHGIWEFRGQKQHFVYSKLMCYVGIDFAMKIAQHFGKDTYAENWAFFVILLRMIFLEMVGMKKLGVSRCFMVLMILMLLF
jgi:hypothetical protein